MNPSRPSLSLDRLMAELMTLGRIFEAEPPVVTLPITTLHLSRASLPQRCCSFPAVAG